MGPGTDSGIENDRNASGRLDHRGQHVERRNAAVGLAAAMIGTIDSVDTAGDRAPRVVRMAYALDDERQLAQRTQPRQVVPGQRITEDRNPCRNCSARILLRRPAH